MPKGIPKLNTTKDIDSVKKHLSKSDMQFFLKKALKNQKLNHANINTVAKWNKEVELYTLALEL